MRPVLLLASPDFCFIILLALWTALAFNLASRAGQAKSGHALLVSQPCCVQCVGSRKLLTQLDSVIAARLTIVRMWLALAAGWCRSLRCCLPDIIYRKDTMVVGWGDAVPVGACPIRQGKPCSQLECIASQPHFTEWLP